MLVQIKRSRKIARMGDPRAEDFAALSADPELINSFRKVINKSFLDLAMHFMKVQVTKPFWYIIYCGVCFYMREPLGGGGGTPHHRTRVNGPDSIIFPGDSDNTHVQGKFAYILPPAACLHQACLNEACIPACVKPACIMLACLPLCCS